ncbi:MAG: hypothetical protein FWG46_06190 [Treponema sp.]|nr:hypothetical protein [Treponema sp.]
MKKLLLVVLIVLLAGAAAFADHPGKVGLGGIASNGYHMGHGYTFNLGLSFQADPVPVFWGLFMHFFPNSYSPNGFALGITGDYYLLEWDLVSKTATNEEGSYDVKIHWYLGAGLFGNLHLGRNEYIAIDAGIRVPFGASWHATDTLEVTAGIAPGIGGHSHRKNKFHFVFPVEVAVRYWWF